MDYITANALIEKHKKGCVIGIQPRKHIACIDGFKYYKINAGTLNKYKYWLKTGWECK